MEGNKRFYLKRVRAMAKLILDKADVYERGENKKEAVLQMQSAERDLAEMIFKLYNYGKF